MARGAAMSTGCAAGPSFEAAAMRALLELVERDAAALWWAGGSLPRPIALDVLGMDAPARLLRLLRGEHEERRTGLLDITSDVRVPVIVAFSTDLDGGTFAAGIAARLDVGTAASAALLELCQMEVGLLLAETRRRHGGDVALNNVDRRHLERAHGIEAACDPRLQPHGEPYQDLPPREIGDSLDQLKSELARIGVDAALVEMTRPEIGIPVVKAIAPGLQLMPCELTTERLRCATVVPAGGNQVWPRGALF
jgi:ribosomal protein S12 methylthiotransferase accessory factor